MEQDLKHLNLLATFHYVVGGIIALFSLFPVIHLYIGIMFLTGSFPEPEKQAGQPDFPVELFGFMFTIIPLIFIVGGMALAVTTVMAGRKLSKKEGYTFCFVIAILLCMFMPFGTALGVCSIIVLSRDSVKRLFGKDELYEDA